MCTRVLWNTDDSAVLTGRSMDWPESTEPLIVAFPRGRGRDGGALAGVPVVDENPLRWTSRVRQSGHHGLRHRDGRRPSTNAAWVCTRSTCNRPTSVRATRKPGLHTGLWAQYLLDQAATVAEALRLMDDTQLVMVGARGFDATLHLAIEDASGELGDHRVRPRAPSRAPRPPVHPDDQ